MANLSTRLAKLESRTSSGPQYRRVISLAGTDPSKEEIGEFLAPFGIDHNSADDLIIVVRALVAPEGSPVNEEIRPAPYLPLRFMQTPGWIKAMPAYEEWMSKWPE